MAWVRIKGDVLNQGDLLRDIAVPSIQVSFPESDDTGTVPLNVGQANIIVLSQSCDLEQKKSQVLSLHKRTHLMNLKRSIRVTKRGEGGLR